MEQNELDAQRAAEVRQWEAKSPEELRELALREFLMINAVGSTDLASQQYRAEQLAKATFYLSLASVNQNIDRIPGPVEP